MKAEVEADVSVKLSKFFLKNVGLWKPKNNRDDWKMKLLTLYTIANMITSFIFQGRDVYYTWYNHGDILYVCTNFTGMMMSIIKMVTILIHKVEFINLIDYMHEHFWNVDYDAEEKKILRQCRKSCTYFTSLVTTVGVCSMISYIIRPFLDTNQSNSTERVLPFDMWLNCPLSETPYYETMFSIQVAALYFIGTCYFCFDNVFCIMSLHLSSQFRILQYRLTNLVNVQYQSNEKEVDTILADYAIQCYQKFKDYVRQHQALINYCEKLEFVYTTVILGTVLLFSVLICLFGYQILVAKATFARRNIFIYLLMGAMILLFMFTYSCDMVIEQSEKVSVASYSALWTRMPMNHSGRSLRNDIIMVINRSRRVCCLTASGFFPVSLETYTKILSTAASYFTLLRNNVDDAK